MSSEVRFHICPEELKQAFSHCLPEPSAPIHFDFGDEGFTVMFHQFYQLRQHQPCHRIFLHKNIHYVLIEDYHIERDRRYFIVISDERQNPEYQGVMGQYLFNPEKLDICSPSSMESWLEDNMLKHYDYYILFDKTPETLQLFEKHFRTTEEVICTLY